MDRYFITKFSFVFYVVMCRLSPGRSSFHLYHLYHFFMNEKVNQNKKRSVNVMTYELKVPEMKMSKKRAEDKTNTRLPKSRADGQ